MIHHVVDRVLTIIAGLALLFLTLATVKLIPAKYVRCVQGKEYGLNTIQQKFQISRHPSLLPCAMVSGGLIL